MLDASDLRGAGLKSTLPRLLVLNIFKSVPTAHLSAEEVYRTLVSQGQEIGLATVYRVLSQLTLAGLIQRNQLMPEGSAMYELSGKGHHDHCVCSQCGRIEEFRDPAIELLQQEAADRHGFRLHTHSLVIFCRCRIDDCPRRRGA